ncbi:hypothetical protein EVAR_88764_1 [Eumeta japonica]|uniref:Uncharacterized protein n=1 Tax=Eumeta variegata TaxID=151549 RepID=A0A4C1XTI1_EUMVA|nr:hypothetical protein EVAR_88764_1 [Eumeta japonica]
MVKSSVLGSKAGWDLIRQFDVQNGTVVTIKSDRQLTGLQNERLCSMFLRANLGSRYGYRRWDTCNPRCASSAPLDPWNGAWDVLEGNRADGERRGEMGHRNSQLLDEMNSRSCYFKNVRSSRTDLRTGQRSGSWSIDVKDGRICCTSTRAEPRMNYIRFESSRS